MAASVAKLLRRPCALFGENVYVTDGIKNSDFTLEGLRVPANGTAILVDDSTTDGHMMLSMAGALRRNGVEVRHAFVIFNRAEGGASVLLQNEGIVLHSIAPIGPAEIETLRQPYRDGDMISLP